MTTTMATDDDRCYICNTRHDPDHGVSIIEHRGRFALARWSERNANWLADMTPRSRKLTGMAWVSARTEAGIICDGNVQTYKTRAGARRALRRLIRESGCPGIGGR